MADEVHPKTPGDIRAWLEQTGYPLEMRVTQRLKKALEPDWDVESSSHYIDPESAELREVDVVVEWSDTSAVPSYWFVMPIECKNTTAPWIVFKGPEREFARDYSPLFRSRATGGMVELSAGAPRSTVADMRKLNVWLKRKAIVHPKPGYGLIEAFKAKNSRDTSYAALNQIVSAGRYFTTGLIGDFIEGEAFSICAPVIVTTSPLFEATLTETDELSVTSVDRASVTFEYRRSADIRKAVVTIVRLDALETLIDDCAVHRDAVKEYRANGR